MADSRVELFKSVSSLFLEATALYRVASRFFFCWRFSKGPYAPFDIRSRKAVALPLDGKTGWTFGGKLL